MQPYGVPREIWREYPDAGDAKRYAMKSSISRSKGPGGDVRSHMKSSSKKRTRRFFKKAARRSAKQLLHLELREYLMYSQDQFD